MRQRWSRRQVIGACAAACVPLTARARAQAQRIAILTDGLDLLGDYGLGVRLGASEAERAATLLGHHFALVSSGAATARITPEARSPHHLPTVAMRGDVSARCVFLTESPEDLRIAAQHVGTAEDAVVADWHPEFRRFGAGELNERFERTFNVGMTPAAWHGWVAVKAVLEAALRDDDICAGLARLRFDGHKGRVLRFDRETRRLRHPALVVRKVGAKHVIEVP